MTNKKVASEFAIGIVLLVALVLGGVSWMQNENIEQAPVVDIQEAVLKIPKNEKQVMCTQDAKLCSDGSYVSRTGPNCEFKACPIIDWRNVEFDSCGGVSKYENLSWWSNFVKQISQVNFYSKDYINSVLKSASSNEYNNPQKIQYTQETLCSTKSESNADICADKDRKLTISDLKDYGEGCLSKDGSVFVVAFPGEYGGGGNYIFRYDIQNNLLDMTKKIDNSLSHDTSWFDPPRSFGKRLGSIMKMTGGAGDAGCGSNSKFDFNIVDNTVAITSRCIKCENDKEKCETY